MESFSLSTLNNLQSINENVDFFPIPKKLSLVRESFFLRFTYDFLTEINKEKQGETQEETRLGQYSYFSEVKNSYTDYSAKLF